MGLIGIWGSLIAGNCIQISVDMILVFRADWKPIVDVEEKEDGNEKI